MARFNNISSSTKNFLIVAVALLTCAAVVFAYLAFGNFEIPELTAADENGNTIQAIHGGYDWRSGGKIVLADSLSPLDFNYKAENILTIRKGASLQLSNNKNNIFNVQDFKLVSLYNNSPKDTGYAVSQGGFKNDNLIITAPKDSGEYIYSIRLRFRHGTVEYGFKVIVAESSGLTDNSADISTAVNRTDAEFFHPMTNHLHTFSFDGKVFTPADDFMLEHAIISDLDASVYFKLDDLCAYARELTSLSDEQIEQIEAYENTKTIYGSRYIRLIDLSDVGINTFVGWEFSSHTPVSFFTNEPDVTAPVTTQ